MGMAGRFRRLYHGGKRRTSKQDENVGRGSQYHLTPHGAHPSIAPLTRQARRGERTGRGDGVRFFDRCLDRCASLPIVPIAVPSHIARMVFYPGEASIPGSLLRAVFLSSSHPPRLIASSFHRLIRSVSSATRLVVPSGQASRQGKTAGGHLRFPTTSSYPRTGPSSPRLAPRVGGRGERRLVFVGRLG